MMSGKAEAVSHKPRSGQTGRYSALDGSAQSFRVDRVEGNLCYVTYAGSERSDPFIWRFHDGTLNTRHWWPGKGLEGQSS